MMLDLDVQEELKARGVTRLVHFTSARNLGAILDSTEIRTRAQLDAVPEEFMPTDKERWDGKRGHVCCSLEYPNARYFKAAEARDRNYEGWVCLLLDPDLAARPGTLFSPVNAATDHGAYIKEGVTALRDVYAPSVGEFERGLLHLASCPTDLQAEVLVPGAISLVSHLRGIVVPDESDMRRLCGRLRMAMGDDFVASRYRWFAAADFFDPDRLTASIGFGIRVPETELH